jgi:hypothetical protein
MVRWSRSRLPAMSAWPADQSRPRVLVECSDGAILAACERLLEANGYAVATCETPESHRRGYCSLVTEGHCPLAETADVVVHTFSPDRPSSAGVIEALCARLPETPVVVHVAAPALEHHAGLLSGCRILRSPMTPEHLVAGVRDAMADAGAGFATAAPTDNRG